MPSAWYWLQQTMATKNGCSCSSAMLRRSFTQREAGTTPPFGESAISHHNDFTLMHALFGLVVEIDHLQCLAHHPGRRAHTPELKCDCRSPKQQRLVNNLILQIVAATSHATVDICEAPRICTRYAHTQGAS